MTDAFKFMHGRVLGEFHLMGDGQVLYGEPYPYQYGLFTDMCWFWLIDYGYSPDTEDSFLRLPFFNQHYDRYDWLGCQFLSGMYIDFGLRQDVPGNQKEDHYTAVLFDELAARADWAFQSPEECNHAPVVTADTTEFTVKAGDTVTLSGSAIDPDGNELTAKWWISDASTTYGKPEDDGSSSGGEESANEEAESGDFIVVNLEVQDTGVERPMTRFAQYFITVE